MLAAHSAGFTASVIGFDDRGIPAGFCALQDFASERCFRRHACLLRGLKEVPADLRSIFAVRRKFPQACMPFKTSAESSRGHQHLFRDSEVLCSAAPKREHGKFSDNERTWWIVLFQCRILRAAL
jgi:hypothetical protein